MSPKTCTVLSCQSVSNESNKKTFFKFPKNQERAKQWLKACGREDLLTKLDVVCQVYTNFFICEDHFDDFMFTVVQRGGTRRLCPTAIPIYFPENTISISEKDEIIESDIDTSEEITVKEEPLRDPLKSEIEIPASPPFVDCESNDCYMSEDPQSGTMEFLPETPVDYPYQEMECSPIDISDDEEPAKDPLPSSSNDDVSIDLTENETLPVLPAERPATGQSLAARHCGSVNVDSGSYIMECRTCLMPVNALRNARLHEKSLHDLTIKEMVSLCVPLMTPHLADADVICRNCLKRLRQCVTFVEDCLRTESRLKERRQSDVEIVEVPYGDSKTVTESPKNNQSILTSLLQGPSPPDPEKFKCPLCWRDFKSKYMLEDHQRKLHKIEREGGYTCNVCRSHFYKLKELEMHWMTHTRYCSVCSKRFMENETCEHIEKNRRESTSQQEKVTLSELIDDEQCKTPSSELLYNCYKCERVIRGEAKYVSHIKMHGHPDRLFFCDKCPKSYGSYKVLRYHQMMSHEKLKTPCKFCSICIWNYNMPGHYRSRHGNEQLQFCKVCDDAFENITEYRSHLREHIVLGHAVGPSKKHNSSKNSNKMVQGATSENGMQPVKCNICFLRFSAKQDLREHLKTHKYPIDNKTECCQIRPTGPKQALFEVFISVLFPNDYFLWWLNILHRRHSINNLGTTAAYTSAPLESLANYSLNKKGISMSYRVMFQGQWIQVPLTSQFENLLFDQRCDISVDITFQLYLKWHQQLI